MVGVSSVIDVEHVDDLLSLVNAVADAVLASTSAPLAHEWRTQLSTNSRRTLGERSEQEFDARSGDCFREVLGQLPCGCPGHNDPEAHSGAPGFGDSARTAASSSTSPRVMSPSAFAMRDWASGSLKSSRVASIDSRSSAASKTT